MRSRVSVNPIIGWSSSARIRQDGHTLRRERVIAMQRTNIYLEEEQLRALKLLATEDRQSVAELVRTAVDDYLAKRTTDETLWRERLAMLLARIRSRVPGDVSPVVIETDIEAARDEVRQIHRVPWRH